MTDAPTKHSKLVAWVEEVAALTKPADMLPFLTNVTEGSILFIDEIHRLFSERGADAALAGQRGDEAVPGIGAVEDVLAT